MKTFYQSENTKDRSRISKALVEIEAASVALLGADIALAMADERDAGEVHADALDAYDKAGKALAAAFVLLKTVKARSAGLAATPRHCAEIIPFNAATRDKHEQDGLPAFSLAKEEGGE